MIGNGYPYGSSGYVILEEGDINPATLQLDVRHYLVVKPDGEQVSGCFSFADAQRFIHEQESKGQEK
ncbi:MAG: hypothetical protein SV765_14395 [Pseudomonadota bacterium]|uniref:hypothetical protein n=1 Tax=Alteromonas australica TaxID=589873 RepID=UPI000C9394F7|nr:hypothetical protein [Alteromonas australica]MAR92222.1 hypothetical protein [Pseudomonadales bacterium]MDY6921392.1 hypothetical protein [Pseudomonadota bacterium]